MLSDLDLVQACARSYAEPPTYQAADCFALRYGPQDGVMRLAFRGSASFLDWLHDLDARTVYTPLGPLHEGFWRDASAMVEVLSVLEPQPTEICGHSKGAAEALIVAASLIAAGWPTPRLMTVGCPKFVGQGSLVPHLLQDCPGAHYRHGLDPVPLLPVELARAYDMARLPRVRETLDVINDHLIPAYEAAVALHLGLGPCQVP